MSGPGYGCAFDDDRPVRWLLTNLGNGSTVSLCDEDFAVGMIPIVATQLGVDPGRLYETVKRFVDREAAKEAKAAGQAEAAAPPSPGADANGQADDDDQGPEVDDPEGRPAYPTAEDYLRAGPA